MEFDPKKLTLYPTEPGVYLMKDHQGRILYIGKAKNLRTRLKQYFAGRDERQMVPYLKPQVVKIDTIIVLTEKEALLLENTLIKRHKPKYNILLKDDKTYVSLVLTDHKWPIIRLIRYVGKPTLKGSYFGPYTNAKAAIQILDLITRLFPLRQCSDSELSNRVRPCLLYDIKKCVAPCVEKCSKEEYDQLVLSAIRLLKGKDKETIKSLHKQMQKASDSLEYEKANKFLEMIKQIEHVTQIQHVDNPAAKNADVLSIYQEADSIVLVQLNFREGKLVGSNNFNFTQIASEEHEIFETFILQHYRGLEDLPSQIFVPITLFQKRSLEEVLSETSSHKVKIFTPQKGKKRDLIKMAYQNAKAIFKREQDARSLKEKMLLDLQDTLQLNRFPRHIECFDTSNISGTDPVASKVSFINGEKEKSHMRLFKVRGSADDYGALREVLIRHFTKQKKENNFCDLLIVDGGKGQLNIALDVFQTLNVASVDVIAVAKFESSHTKGLTQEKIYLPYQKDPILISPRSPMLFLLQKIRDEAHRVAIGFHRKRRSKRTIATSLDNISGIGPKKRKILLKHFGSVKRLKSASEEDLEKLKGINKKDIKTLIKFFESP